MFCYQCEQAAKGTGCTTLGVCSKTPEASALQDLIVHGLKGLSSIAHRSRALGAVDAEADRFMIDALFATVTNVDFDVERLREILVRLGALVERAQKTYEEAARAAGKTPERISLPPSCRPASDIAGLVRQGEKVGIEARRARRGADLAGLEELVVYGLKGAAAYANHARILGAEDPAVYAFFHEALDALTRDLDAGALLALALRTGEVNFKVMELLDRAHTSTFGNPEPTSVRITPVKGKALLVSGHDLKDLETILRQTEGKGVNVYTHGEMLPAHGYPGLKKHKHLVGNYGGAWQDQQKEFEAFPGAIVMTTNCIQPPRETYEARIFTSGLVAFPDVRHVGDGNFAPAIQAALAAPGFAADAPEKRVNVGFGHAAVASVAPAVVEAVKTGKIRHFFLVGGCDGAKPGRNYYTAFAESVPKDCVVLTLACGKFRFFDKDLGAIGGIPRLLDVGQCNDAYSAIRIAVMLAEAFKTDVNSLPLSLVLSWYEQKAVAILLTLLHLGIKNIRIGPSLPAFLTPAVVGQLVEAYGVKPITTPRQDIEAILGAAA